MQRGGGRQPGGPCRKPGKDSPRLICRLKLLEGTSRDAVIINPVTDDIRFWIRIPFEGDIHRETGGRKEKKEADLLEDRERHRGINEGGVGSSRMNGPYVSD
jgi:hypothetical protein